MSNPRVGVLALFVLAISAVGQAQSSAELIEAGLTLREQGHDAEALVLFERAYAQDGAPRSLAQVALAEQAIGRWVEAAQHLRTVLGSGDEWIVRNRSALESSLALVNAHVAHVELFGGVPGAQVLVDQAPAGTLPLAEPLTVSTGRVVIAIHAPGYAPFERVLMLEPGSTTREEVRMVPGTDTGSLVMPGPSGSTHPNWALVGAGFAALGVFWIADIVGSAATGAPGELIALSVIPVLGPFFAFGYEPPDYAVVLSILDGVLQIASLTVGIIGLALQESDAPRFAVAPWVTPYGAGLRAGGTL